LPWLAVRVRPERLLSLEEIERDTRAARKKKLADTAIAKLK